MYSNRQKSKVELHHLAASNTAAQFLNVVQNKIFSDHYFSVKNHL